MSPPRSKLWEYFKKIDTTNARCKICSQNVRHCGNTSNLTKHMNKHPNFIYSETQKMKVVPKQLKLDLINKE